MVETITIKNGNKSISIKKSQSIYVGDVEKYFDTYFYAVDEKVDHLDFTKPRLTKLREWEFPVWLPSFCEPISELRHYLDHAQLSSGDIAIDAGGFAGITAMMMALQVGPNGKVICLEPDPQNHECLLKNFDTFHSIYGYSPTHVASALWSSDGFVEFSSDSAMGSSATQYVGKRGEVIKVSSISLETLTKDLEKIDYVKIDIEGAELELFRNNSFWKNNRPRISVECHSNVSEIKKMLKKINYSFKEVYQSGSQFPLLDGEPL